MPKEIPSPSTGIFPRHAVMEWLDTNQEDAVRTYEKFLANFGVLIGAPRGVEMG